MQIIVRADATRQTAPELALLRVRAAAERAAQAEAAGAATELARRALALVDAEQAAAPGAVTRRVVPPVATRSWRPWGNDGQQLPPVYEGATVLEFEFADVAALARASEALAAVEGLSVENPDWSLTEATRRQLEAEVLREAIGRARERAEVMARESGFSTVRPVQVADQGLGRDADAPRPRLMAAAAMVDDSGLDLSPSQIEVKVVVEAQFAAE